MNYRMKKILHRIKWFIKDWAVVITVVGIFVAASIGLIFGLSYCEHAEDNNNKEALIEHQTVCDGECILISTYSSYGESPTYVYECNKCHKLFEFHNVNLAIEIIGG